MTIKKVANPVFAPIVVVSLLIVVLFSNDATAFQRKVLFEDFTSTTCPPCANNAEAIEIGLEQAGDDVVASIAIHVWWPNVQLPRELDPWWLENNAHNRARVDYYGVRGVPTYKIDGTTYGGDPDPDALEEALREAAVVDSPLDMNLRCTIEDNVLRVTTEIRAEADLNNVRLYIALNEDQVLYEGDAGQVEHFDAMVRMLPDGEGREFSIGNGEFQSFENELDLEGVGWHELEVNNLIVMGWVQDAETVYQAQNFFFAPGVMMDGWKVVDQVEGDGDGRPESGETAGIVITVRNPPRRLVAENLTLTASSNDEQITFENDVIEIDFIQPGEEFVNADNPLNFTVAEEFVAHPVSFNLHLTSEDGMIDIEMDFEIMIDWPEFLIVDASYNRAAAEAMQQYFTGNNLPYADHFNKADQGNVDPDNMDNYDIVIWHSFNQAEDIVNDFEEEILMGYLDNGGCLIMTSSGFVIDNADSRLMRTYFLAALNNSDTEENMISGIEGDPHFEGGRFYAGGNDGSGAGDPMFQPSIAALDGGREVLEWTRADEASGVSNVNDTYMTLLLSFPIESIEGFSNTDSREEFLMRVYDWYNNPDDPDNVPPDPDAKPQQFSLNAAYPNPFNSKTMIPFTLGASGELSLGLFDISGREIVQLLNASLQAGEHLISLDAKALGLASGVYYLKLSSGVNTAKQKILFLR